MITASDTAEYTDAIVSGDRARAAAIFHRAVAGGTDFVTATQQIVQPALYAIGEGWQQNRISVAQERLATAICYRVLVAELALAVPAGPNGYSAVFICGYGNFHWLGLHIVANAFALAGWDAVFTGADTPADAVARFVAGRAPDVVGLSLTRPEDATAASNVIAEIRRRVRDKTLLFLIGGLAIRNALVSPGDVGAEAAAVDAASGVKFASEWVQARDQNRQGLRAH